MGYSLTTLREAGKAGLNVTLLGLGCVQIGGWPRFLDEAEAVSALEGAWSSGVRLFDTAPMYGFGVSEERLGHFLQTKPREEFVISSKVGRLIGPADSDVADESFWRGAPLRKAWFDFSYDGVMRSVEESLMRLGLSSIDMLHIHDPDLHYEAAIDGAYRALDELRRTGAIQAVGAGMNQTQMLTRFAEDGVFDCFLIAGRYTLLDHDEALRNLLPVCRAKGISLLIGGVFNSGVLIDPKPGAFFDYERLDEGWRERVLDHGVRQIEPHETGAYWLSRAQEIAAICERHGVPLPAAALQFAAAEPAVASIVVGAGKPGRMRECGDLLAYNIPSDLWTELRQQDLLHADAPILFSGLSKTMAVHTAPVSI